jgi:ParB/RepB/Spo0J family partition protein
MNENVEISSLDLRYEGCRMKSERAETALLASISEYGLREPLQGVNTSQGIKILLDGFKRYRCAKKLNIQIVPFYSVGEDEAMGLIQLMRVANAKSLTILEQARLIEQLRNVYQMSVAEIAQHLEKSKAWVSVRNGILAEMSPSVLNQIFEGRFPMYAYMYVVRPFMRINKIPKQVISEFVEAASGNNLSLRDIELLAHGYFNGSDQYREQIKEGNISWILSRLKHAAAGADQGCSEFEQRTLKDLQIVQKYMHRLICTNTDRRLKNQAFFAQANILTSGIVTNLQKFADTVSKLHDRSRQA